MRLKAKVRFDDNRRRKIRVDLVITSKKGDKFFPDSIKRGAKRPLVQTTVLSSKYEVFCFPEYDHAGGNLRTLR
jgi:hypothetical protein